MGNDDLIRIVELVAEDDQHAFREFFDAFYPSFFQLAFYLLKSDMLAEEAVSEVFVKLWNNRKNLPGIERLKGYLYTSVRNQCMTCLKEQRHHQSLEDIPVSKLMVNAHPESLLLDKELAKTIDDAVARLPEHCRMVFHLVKIDGLSYKEAANALGISHKTVEGQMVIALKKIKAALRSYAPHYGKFRTQGIIPFLMFFL